MTRLHAATRPDPGAFRCLVCRIYVTGTPAGHCPRCGFVPPSAPPAAEPSAPMALWPLLAILVLAATVMMTLVL